MIDTTVRDGSKWVWDLKWRKDLFESELVTLEELLKDLKSLVFSVGVDF
jgi:hypothetical protein